MERIYPKRIGGGGRVCGSRESHTVSNSEITEIIQKELWRMPYRPDALNYPVRGKGREGEWTKAEAGR